jgi:hypothetical protein
VQSLIIGEISYILSAFLWIFSNKNKNNETNERLERENKMLCRFVLDGVGRNIGESVAVDEDILIIKKGKKYLGVPLKHIEEEGKALLVKGLVNHVNAEKMGEKWRSESFKEIEYDDEEE